LRRLNLEVLIPGTNSLGGKGLLDQILGQRFDQSSPGDAASTHFFADAFLSLEQQNLNSLFRQERSTPQTAGTASHDNNIVFHNLLRWWGEKKPGHPLAETVEDQVQLQIGAQKLFANQKTLEKFAVHAGNVPD
jgi:hypothetical protein